MYCFFKGGKSARIVNSVLALKSYNEWKQAGGNGVWKFGGNVKLTTPMRHHVRKNSEPFTNSLSRNTSMNEKSLSNLCPDSDSSKMVCYPSIFRTCSLAIFQRSADSNFLFVILYAALISLKYACSSGSIR